MTEPRAHKVMPERCDAPRDVVNQTTASAQARTQTMNIWQALDMTNFAAAADESQVDELISLWLLLEQAIVSVENHGESAPDLCAISETYKSRIAELEPPVARVLGALRDDTVGSTRHSPEQRGDDCLMCLVGAL